MLFIIFALLLTISMYIWFSPSLAEAWEKGLAFTIKDIKLSMELSLTFFIFISFPVLLFRFMYYFSKMIYRGRKPNVAILNVQTLYNPLYFLFMPRLLNTLGMDYRRRCLVALILLIAVYVTMFFINN